MPNCIRSTLQQIPRSTITLSRPPTCILIVYLLEATVAQSRHEPALNLPEKAALSRVTPAHQDYWIDMSRAFYSELDAERHEIRLLALKPGQPEDDIHVNPLTASLHNKLEYEALSYVWGNPQVRRHIACKAANLR